MRVSVAGFTLALLAVGIGAAAGGYWLAQRQAGHGAKTEATATQERPVPVSYTHLTLPTNREV